MNLRLGMLAGLVAAVALAAGCGSMSAAGTSGGGWRLGQHHGAKREQLPAGHERAGQHKGMTLYTLSAERGGRFICTASSMIPGGSASCCRCGPADGGQGQHADRRGAAGHHHRPDTGVTQVTWHGRRSTRSPATRRPGTHPATASRTSASGRRPRWGRRPRARPAAAADTATEPRAARRAGRAAPRCRCRALRGRGGERDRGAGGYAVAGLLGW